VEEHDGAAGVESQGRNVDSARMVGGWVRGIVMRSRDRYRHAVL